MGGSFWNWGNGTTLTTNGNTSVSIDGGSTFTGKIVGGSWRGSTWTAEDPTAPARQHWRQHHRHPWTGHLPGRHLRAGNCGTVGGKVHVSLTGGSIFGEEGEENGITIGGSAGAAVEGNRTLELKGTFGTGDFQNVTFTRFDEINIAQEGASATIYALTDSPALTKTGAGTLTLGADAAGAETILDGTTGRNHHLGRQPEPLRRRRQPYERNVEHRLRLPSHRSQRNRNRRRRRPGRTDHRPGNGKHRPGHAGVWRRHQQRQRNGKRPEPVHKGEGLTLDLSNDAVVNLLLDHKTDDSSSYLTLTSGTLTVGDLGDIAFTTDLLSNYGIRVTGTDGGSLVLSGAATGLYRVQEEGGNAHEVNSLSNALRLRRRRHRRRPDPDGQPGRSPGRIRTDRELKSTT